MTRVLLRNTQTGEKTQAHGGRDWSDVVRSQGIPSHERVEEARKPSPLEPLGWSVAC